MPARNVDRPDVLLAEDAERDIALIARYTSERWGEAQRDRYLDALETFFRGLADPLTAGRRCPHIGPDVRVKLFQRNYWVYYRRTGRTIHVLRILHTSRSAPEGFGPPTPE